MERSLEESVDYASPNLVDLTVRRANLLLEMDRADEAVGELMSALSSAPDDPDLLCNLSRAYINLGQWKQGLEAADLAVMSEPNEEWGHRLRSVALRKLRRPWDALDAARNSLKLSPDNQWSLYTMALAELACFDKAAADRTIERLLTIAPDFADAHELAAFTLLDRRKEEVAEHSVRKALSLDPESSSAMLLLGNSLHYQRRRTEAIDAYFQACKLDPTDTAARDNLELEVNTWMIEQPWAAYAPVPIYIAQCLVGSIGMLGLRLSDVDPKGSFFLMLWAVYVYMKHVEWYSLDFARIIWPLQGRSLPLEIRELLQASRIAPAMEISGSIRFVTLIIFVILFALVTNAVNFEVLIPPNHVWALIVGLVLLVLPVYALGLAIRRYFQTPA